LLKAGRRGYISNPVPIVLTATLPNISAYVFSVCPPVSDPVGNLSCWGQSWDSIQLSWDQPANPNGQVLFYQILVDSVMATGPATHQAFSASEYTVGGLEPDQLYTLSVSAVNSAGPGDQINCTTNTLPESGRMDRIG